MNFDRRLKQLERAIGSWNEVVPLVMPDQSIVRLQVRQGPKHDGLLLLVRRCLQESAAGEPYSPLVNTIARSVSGEAPSGGQMMSLARAILTGQPHKCLPEDDIEGEKENYRRIGGILMDLREGAHR
jgi:hypothetical protein